MGIFDGWMLCSDIDGTLSWNGVVSAENRAAIASFEKEGGLFIISTGRQPEFIREELHLDVQGPVIGTNGTLIRNISTGEELFRVPMDLFSKQVAKELCSVFEQQIGNAHFCYGSRLSQPIRPDKAIAEVDRVDPQDPLQKIVFSFDDPEDAVRVMHYVRDHYDGQVEYDRSWPHGVEIHAIGSGKDACLRFLKNRYQIKTAAAVGDYENDMKMLQAADISFAVENAIESLKEIADHMAPHCSENAVAWIIEQIRQMIRE